MGRALVLMGREEGKIAISRVGIIFYPPKPHRSRGTEIEFWTPCGMLYQRKMPTMF